MTLLREYERKDSFTKSAMTYSQFLKEAYVFFFLLRHHDEVFRRVSQNVLELAQQKCQSKPKFTFQKVSSHRFLFYSKLLTHSNRMP